MVYLIQEGFYKEENYHKLVQALEETNSSYKVITVNLDGIECNLVENEKYIIFGGNRFSAFAQDIGLHPGTYKNDNFNHSVCVENWGSDMLNYIYVIGDIFSIEPTWDTFFLRPLLDDKIMTGKVATKIELEQYRKRVNIAYKDKLLIASEVKEILKEYRLFIVDNEIITGSLYKVEGQLYTYSDIPEKVKEYAEKVINAWQPSLAYALDIAETVDGLKIIEINNINATGFYKANVSSIVKALNKLNS
jgi:hypothetical protein